MRENCVQSMAKQVGAQTHEESKLWRASQPLPNQSSKQGRKSEKKSNSQQFRKPCEMPKEVQAAGQRARLWKMNFAPYAKFCKPCETKVEENEFHTLCEISQALRKSSYVIFRYFCIDSVRFLSQDICVITYFLLVIN